MKAFILILIALSPSCYAQYPKEVKTFPEVEREVLDTINEYRVKNGLKEIIWCEKAYNAAFHHSYYLSDMKKIPSLHYETTDDENFDELLYFDDRLRKFVKHGSPYGVENIVTADFDDWWFQRKDLDPIKNAYKCIFQGWKDSPGHNDGMLDKKVTHGAIAIVRELKGDWCRVVLVFYKS